MRRTMKLHPTDAVATALEDISAGDIVAVTDAAGACVQRLTALEAIGEGHKIALREIKKGETVQKYGHVIGMASQDIQPGARVHTHNLESLRGRGDLR